MALKVPEDVPGDPFTRAGLLTLDGGIFEEQSRVGTSALRHEVEYLQQHIPEAKLEWRVEWLLARDAFLLWCFSHRAEMDNLVMNAFFRSVGLASLDVSNDPPQTILAVLKAGFDMSVAEPMSPAGWINPRSYPRRLPSLATRPSVPLDQQEYMIIDDLPSGSTNTDRPTLTKTQRPSLGIDVNSKYQGKYNFTDHQQEYEGYQFQCLFRCLKDGKHCRKAPVREMNRHLRVRHNFRPGFKIAGVDWEKKRWRGAGAEHEECIGKIVERDADDDAENSPEGENEEENDEGQLLRHV